MSDPAIDATVLHRLYTDIGADAAVMKELVDTFLDQGPQLVAEARASAASGDWRRLNRAVHTLKSSALTFGAARLGALCRELEEGSIRGPVRDAAARMDAIGSEWTRASAALRAWAIPAP